MNVQQPVQENEKDIEERALKLAKEMVALLGFDVDDMKEDPASEDRRKKDLEEIFRKHEEALNDHRDANHGRYKCH